MEENKQLDLTFSDLLGIFKRCWILMAAVALVVTILTYVIMVNTHQDEYTSTVGMWAYRTGSDDDTGNVQENYYGTIMSTQNIDEYMEIAQSRIVLERVIADQNLTITPKKLAKMLDASQKGNANTSTLFYLSVTAASPESARRLGEAWSRVACEYINEDLVKKDVVLVFDPAPLPDQPSNPISLLKILLIAFACAVIVYGVYFVRFLMDDKVNNAEDVEKYLDLHVLGAIPDKNQLSRRRSKGAYYAQSRDVKLN